MGQVHFAVNLMPASSAILILKIDGSSCLINIVLKAKVTAY